MFSSTVLVALAASLTFTTTPAQPLTAMDAGAALDAVRSIGSMVATDALDRRATAAAPSRSDRVRPAVAASHDPAGTRAVTSPTKAPSPVTPAERPSDWVDDRGVDYSDDAPTDADTWGPDRRGFRVVVDRLADLGTHTEVGLTGVYQCRSDKPTEWLSGDVSQGKTGALILVKMTCDGDTHRWFSDSMGQVGHFTAGPAQATLGVSGCERRPDGCTPDVTWAQELLVGPIG